MKMFENLEDKLQLKMQMNQILTNQIFIMRALDALLYNSGIEEELRNCLKESAKVTAKIMGVEVDENGNS